MLITRMFFAGALLAPTIFGSAIDSVTLTPSGAEMNFTITGTYLAGTYVTPFSAPGAPYILTFTLPTAPASVVPKNADIFGLDAPVTLNGVNFPNSQIIFFDAAADGGFDVCLNQICTPPPHRPTIFWDVFTDPELLFSGTVSKPTLLAGSYTVEPGSSYTITPEPASEAILGAILLGLYALARRNRPHSSR